MTDGPRRKKQPQLKSIWSWSFMSSKTPFAAFLWCRKKKIGMRFCRCDKILLPARREAKKKHHQRQWIMKLIEQNKQQFIKISIINHLSTHIFFHVSLRNTVNTHTHCDNRIRQSKAKRTQAHTHTHMNTHSKYMYQTSTMTKLKASTSKIDCRSAFSIGVESIFLS